MLRRLTLHTQRASDFVHSRFFSIIGLIFSIFIASVVWFFAENYFTHHSQNLFEHYVHENHDATDRRMHKYENALRSGIGFMEGSDYVSRDEWRQFFHTLDITKNYEGVQGIGLSMMLSPQQVKSTEKRMRAEGYPEFALRPAGKREQYSSILYLEPMDKRNRAAIGYDMFSEPTRHEAMLRAADTGELSISDKVMLVQEIDQGKQAGCIMYLPLYQKDAPLNTTEQRRAALLGFVYAPFRMNDLMKTLDIHDETVRIEIYDGPQRSQEHLLYRSDPSSYISKYATYRTLTVGGSVWSIYYSSKPYFDQSTSSFYPVFATMAGLGFYFVLLYIIVDLLKNRALIRKNRDELERNRFWLSTVLGSSIDGIHILDMKGNLIDYSPSFIAMLGYNDDEAKKLDVFHWDARFSKFDILIMIESLQHEPITFESVFRKKDGTLIDVEITSQRIIMDEKHYVFASSRDITERKNGELALINEKLTAKNYLDIVDVMILVIDINFNIKMINRKGCEILGYSVSEAMGKNFVDLFIPDRLKNVLQTVVSGIINDEGYEIFENSILTKSGEERLISWRNRPLMDENGIVTGVLSSGEDITDIRKAQQALRDSEEFYRTIFSSVSEGIIILENNIVVDCNDLALELFEADRDFFIGENINDSVHDIQCKKHDFEFYLDSAASGFYTRAECTLHTGKFETESKIVEFTLSCFGSKSEDQIIMTARDITKRLGEEKLLRMKTRQAQMGEMISMIAHQWRQPLAIISAISSQLRLKLMLSDNEDLVEEENLRKIEEQCTHLSQTITEYRDFFRPDKPKELFNLSVLVRHALNLIDHTLKTHGISIEEIIVRDSKHVSYRNEVLQVLIALLKNSLDAFEEHGIHQGQIIITVDQDEHNGIIMIHDNAGGITPEIMKKLFVPYFTTKEHNIGTGLGLYMSKIIIEEHCGGIVDVTSVQNETTFTIKLPIVEREV
jgi:PAS domain S-box-containing protein